MSTTTQKAVSFALRAYPGDIAEFKELATKHPNQQETFNALLKGSNTNENNNVNESLQSELTDLQVLILEKNAQIEELNDISNKLKAQNLMLLNDLLKTKIQDPAFVFTPSNEIKNNMQRAITYMITKGKLNRQGKDLPAQFTEQAINYFINNEFTHIKK